MSEMIERVSLALMGHLRADEKDDFMLAARAAIKEIGEILANSQNSSLGLAGDELLAELRERT